MTKAGSFGLNIGLQEAMVHQKRLASWTQNWAPRLKTCLRTITSGLKRVL